MTKQKTKSKNPRCVIINDVHFTVPNLALAAGSLWHAFEEARALNVPLVIAGDLIDSKAIIRGEVMNRLIEIFKENEEHQGKKPFVMVGNHDRINEKGTAHSLGFLEPYALIVSSPTLIGNIAMIPYMHDTDELKRYLADLQSGTTVICHQGVIGADMGHYVQDKSAIDVDLFARFRTVSGHYHKRQHIEVGKYGGFDYLGNPYTQSFAEANDPEKGFNVLHWDGSLTHRPTWLRKHVIIEGDLQDAEIDKDDLLWLKIAGSASELAKISKAEIAKNLPMGMNFKLDKIITVSATTEEPIADRSKESLLDSLIDRLNEPKPYTDKLKALWRELLEDFKS